MTTCLVERAIHNVVTASFYNQCMNADGGFGRARLRNATAKQFERIGFRHEVPRMVQEVTGLETHWAYYRCVNGYNEGALMKGQPFYSLARD